MQLPRYSVALMLLVLVACVMLVEPALAGNKFETIGQGVSGQVKIKREYLQIIFTVVGGVLFAFGLLTVFMPRNNAAMLNYTLWKQSAAIFFILSLCAFAGAYFI